MQSSVSQRRMNLSPAQRLLLKKRLGGEFAGATSIPRLVALSRPAQLPLSFAQKRLWFLAQIEGVSEAYHIPAEVRLKGELNRVALRRALDRILARHEVLRTTFTVVEGEPVQRIAAKEGTRFHLLEHDLRGQDGKTELERLAFEEFHTRFDFETGPLIRGRLIRLAEHEYTMLITMHHVVSDGWSMDLFFGELSVLYAAFLRGQEDPLPGLAVQYSDYAVWQRQWIEGDILQQQADYWRSALAGAPELLNLPTDHTRPAQQQYAGSFSELVLDESLTQGLKALSKRHGVTLYMTLIGAWAVLLSRLSGQDDVVIGTPSANRGRMEIENLIGFFVNMLALRLDLSGSPPAGDLLVRVKQQVLAALEHQDIPFEKVVEITRPVRSASCSPLFQIMFSWQNVPERSIELPSLEVALLPSIAYQVSKYDLTLAMREENGKIAGKAEYATSLFESPTIERFLAYYRRLLEGMIADESQAMNCLPMLPNEERQQLVYDWNKTGAQYPRENCIQSLFEEQVERSPEVIAAICEEGSLSYQELNGRANQLANYLRALGVGPEVLVGICMERGLEMLIGLMGILKAGGAYVPLDPDYPVDRLAYMMENSQAPVLVTRSGLLDRLPVSWAQMICVDERWEEIAKEDSNNVGCVVDGSNPAYVIYTSGSTGKPKGVAVTHDGLTNYLVWSRTRYPFNEGQVTPVHSSIAFDFTITPLLSTLLAGRTVILVSGSSGWYEANGSGGRAFTMVKLTPSHLEMFGNAVARGEFQRRTRSLILGGETLYAESLTDWWEENPEVRIFNEYGPTETVVGSCCYEVLQGQRSGAVPIGRPIANTQIYILDERGEPVPVGVTGELYIGGAGVARGYLKRPELTAERFLPDPFTDKAGARMYRTGDLGRWLSDGNIEFLGRNDNQVKIRGYRIELGEVEARLLEHAEVREAVVLGREDTPGEKRLVAYYTASGESDVAAEVLRAHLSVTLPEHMVPAAYVRMEQMPLTANGKVDRKALPMPGTEAFAVRGYEAPQGEIEEKLAAIWAEVLKVERVGRHDNFFELGGHSLVAVALIERMRQQGLRAEVRMLFAAPTLCDLASTVTLEVADIEVPPNGIPLECEAIKPEMLSLIELSQEEIGRIVEKVEGGTRNVQDIYPLAPLQEGILFHHLLGPGRDPYLSGQLMSFDTRVRLDRYLEALQGVIDRHDIMRTGVMWEGLREPVQVVWRKVALPVEEVELDRAQGDVGEQLYTRFNPRRYRMDVGQAPLLRVYVAEDRERGRWLMLQLLHHLWLDHTTGEVIHEEIQAHLLGQEDKLPAPLPFRNLVAQARLGVSREEHEAFFRRMLGDVEEPTAPFGMLDVRGDGTGIDEARILLDSGLARRIREQARKLRVSAASLCHLAWAQVLARVTGREDVVFGTVLFGRMQGGAGADRAMGLFINTLPIRVRVGEEGVEASVRRTHALLVELLQHEQASLALAQRCSGVVGPTPLFSALLNYRHSEVQARSEEAEGVWEGMEELRSEDRTNYPLTLSVDDLGEGFGLVAQTPALLQPKPMRVCEYMRTALEGLVGALETAPGTAVRSVDVLPESERRQVVYEWNETASEYPGEKCIHELFEEQVERSPDATAVVFEGASLSYAELNRRANQLAHYLRAQGVKPDERVGIVLERSVELLIAELAILKCGATYVPIDPASPAGRKNFMIRDCGAKVVVTIEGMEVPETDGYRRIDMGSVRSRKWSNLDAVVGSEAIAYVMYTSGSAGEPKGAMVPHRAIARLVFNNGYLAFRFTDRVVFAANPAFDAATMEVWGALLNGGCTVVIRQNVMLEPARFKEVLRREAANILWLTVGLFNQYADELSEAIVGLRYLIVGGDKLDSRVVARLLRRCRPKHLLNGYGPTETTTFATTYEIREVADDSMSIPIGRPIANAQIYILDERREPVPVGVAGELYIGGAGVARGYLNRPDLTAERFLPDPFASEAGARMYKTGDLGRWLADGNIEFLGRNDFQVKIRGYRIEPGEIEARLASHPGVRETVVVAREDEPGDKRLVAYYTASGVHEQDVGAEVLRAHMSLTLPDYMVPTAYVRLEQMPLTANGKLDRKALPDPGAGAYAVGGYEAPEGEIEQKLAAIWAEVLKVERVGRHDNFFKLGGHSLAAVTLIERMRQQGLKIDVRSVFATPTLAELAVAIILRRDNVEVPPNRIPAECERIRPEMLSLIDLSQEEINGIVQRVAGGTGNVQEIYPLAPLQEGILFHHLMNRGSDLYLLIDLFSFNTRTRLNGYLEALQGVIDRHDILRTAVMWEGLREPVQVVWRKVVLPVEEVELDPAQGDVGEQLYTRFNPRRYRMDVRQAPLLRVYVAEDREKGYWLLLLLQHHLSIDHTTKELMQAEIQAHLLGEADKLPAPLPFRNVVAEARLGVSREEHEAFFRRMLGDVEEPTAPFGLMDVRGDGTGIEEAQMLLDSSLARRIRERARKLGVSAASLCHLAWAQVLARVTGREDVVFGTILFGRMQGGEGADRVMGLFINTLPVRIRVGEKGVEASVREVHKQLGELLRHEHASLGLAQRCSGVAAPTPLFSALLNYRHSGVKARSHDAERVWEGTEWLRSEDRTNYPVTLSIDDLGEEFRLTGQTVASVNPMRLCEFIRAALEGLVGALEVEPDKAVGRVEVLPEEERRQVLYGWNQTATEYPREKCIHELFEEQVERSPDATAVVFEGAALSYAELNRRANRLAHYLRDHGVGPDQRVAICVERGFEMIVGLLGILKAGGGYVPLDPAYPAERLRYMLEDSGSIVLLSQRHLRELFNGMSAALPVVDLSDVARWQEQPERNPERSALGLGPEHLAYVIYTSGSTGVPKAVIGLHRATVNRFAWMYMKYPFESGEVCCARASLNFVDSIWELLGPLAKGVPIVVLSSSEHYDVIAFLDVLRKRQVTRLVLVPSLLHAIVESSLHRKSPLPDLKYWITSGDELLHKLVTQFWGCIQGGKLINLYGSSEDAGDVTCYELTSSVGGSLVPVGRPIANTRVYILDSHGEPVPVGVAGELYIGGVQVARGYLNRAELTAERFLPDPFTDKAGARMYRTGDLGRWLPDGNIEFLGRNDNQVKIRGFRIELGEVKARLLEHAEVREAVVLAREDTSGEKRLVAYYTAGDEQGPGVEELRGHLKLKLPEHMVPAAYVRMERMPLTANGKLDRKSLPGPEGYAYVRCGYEEPRGEVERKLAEIWGDVLRVERVGRQDNFFELGGHSLLAVRAISRIQQELSVEVALADLFARPLLSDFADCVEAAKHKELPPITMVERGKRLPLSFAQQRLWFLAQMKGVSEAYHIPFGVRLKGDLHRVALQQALDWIVVRHEVLRTSFVASVHGEAEQRIAPVEGSHFHLSEQDIREHSDVRGELGRLVAQEASTPFDLEAGPLIRGRLVREAEDEHVLLLTMHHIVSDGWSMGIFVNELSALYSAFLRGGDDPLPELGVQYADYTAWQREWIEGEILREQGEYWKGALAGAPALLELPTDHSRPAEKDYAGAFTALVLDAELTARLKDLSKRRGVTLYITLLAGWAALLGRLSGQQEVVVGTPVANRGRSEIEGLIGFFVNTLALRLDLGGTPTVGELLERVKGQALAAQKHQDIPFEQVVEIIRPVRSLSHSPVFQVEFAWQNAPGGRLELPGLEIRPLESAPHVKAKFDLTLFLRQEGGRIVGGVEYATSLFEESTIQRYLGYFHKLLKAMVIDEGAVVDRIPILPEVERKRVLYEWNDTAVEYPKEKCVHELFEEQVERSREATAVVFEGEELTYGELNRRANRLAHYLRELGVKPDSRVALCVERGFEMVVGLLAVLKADGAYVPLDPAYPAERLRYMLEDSGSTVLLGQRHLRELFNGMSAALPVVDLSDVARWQEQPERNPERSALGLGPEHLAYVIYTSGSTGAPKGIELPHRALVNLLKWHKEELGESKKTLQFASLGFDASFHEMFSAWINGGAVFIVNEEMRRDVTMLSHFNERNGVEKATLPVTVLQEFADLEFETGIEGRSTSLHEVIATGEQLRVTVGMRSWFAKGSRCRLINHYGPSETHVVTAYTFTGRPEGWKAHAPIGRPIANTQIYILDERGEPVPVRVAGELYIGGAGLARGYLNRPELTAERFLPDPFASESGARMYRTGDLGRWLPDANIEFLGRNDNQVKIRGFRIELGEVEARLLEHAGVREAVVLAREDTPGEKRLVAYFSAADEGGEALGATELRSHLTTRLPGYMVPAAYVRMERMPLTANGKLDREALPMPERQAYAVHEYELPEGDIETVLASIWAEILNLEQVGRHDNFFELGGHSLLTLQVVYLLRDMTDIVIYPNDIYNYQTIDSLSRQIRSSGWRVLKDRVIPSRKKGSEPPLFMTHDGSGELSYVPLLARHINSDIPVYGLPARSPEEPQMRTMQDMAARMLAMMRSVQPAGPYRVAGWSLGGILAYEIGTQLIGADQDVDFIGLFDTVYPPVPMSQNVMRDYKLDLLTVTQVVPNRRTREYVGEIIEQLRPQLAAMDFAELVQKCRDTSILPIMFSHLNTHHIERFIARWRTLQEAGCRWAPEPISVPVHLFVAQEHRSDDPLLGWGKVLPGSRIRTIPVPGNHHSMMGAHAQSLGEALTNAIRDATRNRSFARNLALQ